MTPSRADTPRRSLTPAARAGSVRRKPLPWEAPWAAPATARRHSAKPGSAPGPTPKPSRRCACSQASCRPRLKREGNATSAKPLPAASGTPAPSLSRPRRSHRRLRHGVPLRAAGRCRSARAHPALRRRPAGEPRRGRGRAPGDVLPVGLAILSALAQLCRSASASLLQPIA